MQTGQSKFADRTEKAKVTGKKPRGREPKPPTPGPQPTDQVNLTDEQSRIMPTSGGGFEQAYNAQAAVDMESLLIVEHHITHQVNDKQQIEPALKNLATLPPELGTVILSYLVWAVIILLCEILFHIFASTSGDKIMASS